MGVVPGVPRPNPGTAGEGVELSRLHTTRNYRLKTPYSFLI